MRRDDDTHLGHGTPRLRRQRLDVEGAELEVLRGAGRTLHRWKPYVVFEHGLGAADSYGTSPGMVHELLVAELSGDEFRAVFVANRVWDFVARPYAADPVSRRKSGRSGSR
ncbi:MAG TPA: FkbM family methyltransferase [Candidatus Binatia bacterium]|nr:FkbM family methyltransferase [Candidatus Binatia bacterium]